MGRNEKNVNKEHNGHHGERKGGKGFSKIPQAGIKFVEKMRRGCVEIDHLATDACGLRLFIK